MSAPSVCFLGCGAMSARHIRTLRRLRPGLTVGVASRDAQRAQSFGGRVGAKDCFGSYETAIASSYDVIAVVVPPSAHRALVEQAVRAGKHVLVEKPAFNSLAELETLWPLLKSAAGVVMVAENLHFAPFHRKLAGLVRAPALGRPLLLDLIRLGRSAPRGWRADPAEMPLGALHEGGVHWIRRLMDFAAVFEADATDHVLDVSAFAPPAPVTTTPGEDTMMVVARHRSGLVSRLFHTWAVPWRFPPFDASKILLEHGALYFDARGLGARFYAPGGRRFVMPSVRDAGGFREMWRHFLSCVEARRPPDLTLEHVFADFAYLDAAYRSTRSHRPEAPSRPPPLAQGPVS